MEAKDNGVSYIAKPSKTKNTITIKRFSNT
jgi:hypothetical protein